MLDKNGGTVVRCLSLRPELITELRLFYEEAILRWIGARFPLNRADLPRYFDRARTRQRPWF